MSEHRFRILKLLTALTFFAFACSSPLLVPTAEPLPSPTPTWTLLPTITPTPAPTDTPSPPSPTPETPSATPSDPMPTRTPEPFVCPGAPESRVNVGGAARVTFTNGLPLRVRETPVVNKSNVILQIPEGTEFDIIDGPECAPIPGSDGSFVFWKVRIGSGEPEGWVAEGADSIYYIEPLP